MTPGTAYPRNTALAFLLAGNPGSGKTVACFAFPDPFILDCEGNLKSGIERNPTKRFWWASPAHDYDASGKITKTYTDAERWTRAEQMIRDAGTNPEVKTICVDGLATVADWLKAWLIEVASANSGEKLPIIGGAKQMTQALWGEYGRRLHAFVSNLRSFAKPVVVTVHLKVDESEMTSVKEYQVNVQGKSAVSMAGKFTDFYQLVSVPHADPKYAPTGGVRFYIRTASTSRIELKSHNNKVIPAEMELGDAAWTALIKGLTPPAAPAVEPPKPPAP